ncbi:MAG: hypothetical protein GY832_11135 [Chloroflexi bacterium]|nr:hypothetical protein [Chloroflexota bacterium]
MANKTTSFIQSRPTREVTITLDHTDSEMEKRFRLPAGSRLIDFIVNVKEAFAGGVEQFLFVGTLTEGILEEVSLATEGRVTITNELMRPGYETTEVTNIYAFVSDDGNTAGEVDVTFIFSTRKLTRM